MNFFKQVSELSKKENTPVYIVGGYVRDSLLGKKNNRDVDFAVEGSGLKFAKKFDEAVKEEGSLVEFPDFDTARYILGESKKQFIIEFAGTRTEHYHVSSRNPKVKAARLKDDLERRDFTVNAMAMPVNATGRITKNKIIDPFNGRADLQAKILKTPLDPNTTFIDDPLRMLRAARFSAQLGFGIDAKTLKAIHLQKDRIKIVSAERILEELLKLLATSKPSDGFNILFQTHLLDSILPEVSALDGVEDIYGHQHKNNLVHTFKVVDNIAEHSTKVWLRMAGLLHDIGKPGTKQFKPKIGWTFHAHEHLGKKMIQKIAKRLKFSNDDKQYLAKMVRWHMQPIALMDKGITDSAVRRLFVTFGDQLEDLLVLGRSDITTGNPNKKEKRLKNYDNLTKRVAEVIERDKLRSFQSPVRGEEIMKLGRLKPGPTVGAIKKAIEEAILDGKIPNQYKAAKDYFTEIKNDYLVKAADWEKIK